MTMRKVLFLISLLISFSCTQTEDNYFPSYRVNLELDLTFEDKALNEQMAYKTYIAGQTSGLAESELTGFGGVLVYHGLTGIAAYDLACPYEQKRSIRIEVDSTKLYAICPECGSTFNIWEGTGTHISGPATRGLKIYSTIQTGNKIIVTN